MDSLSIPLLPFPMVRPRRPHVLSDICHPERSEGSAFLGSSLATRSPRVLRGRSPLATIPFRITFFARPHPLTSIESYSYKKRGWGWGPEHFPLFPPADKRATRSNAGNPNLFMRLLHGSLDTPGGGILFPLCDSSHSAPLRYPFPLLASPLCLNAGGRNEP
jgi:hypothetical protein